MKSKMYCLLLSAIAAGTTGAAYGQAKSGPVATYWVTAETSSGMAADGNSNPAAAALAMLGGGQASSVRRSLLLQLGSVQLAQGTPSAEHYPPAGLRAGASLPLRAPTREPARAGALSRMAETPKGKIRIFWGCGATAAAGQSIVIDLSKPSAAAASQMAGSLSIKPSNPPSAANSRTFGEWPNDKTRAQVPVNGSLIGSHLVRGNHIPEIRFALGKGQDFMEPLRLSGTERNAAGAFPLTWAQVPGALGYFAYVMGGNGKEMVMWSSSDLRLMPGEIPDYLSPSEVKNLVSRKVLMAPTATSCTVPKEVAQIAPNAMLRMVAFGDEVNFSYPPRAADARATPHPEHVVKVRYASTTSVMLGMPSLLDPEAQDEDSDSPKKKRSLMNGLGGLLR